MKIEVKEIEFSHDDIFKSEKYYESGIYKVISTLGKHLMFVSKEKENLYSLFIDDTMIYAIDNSFIKEENKEEEKQSTSITEDTLLKAISIIAHNTKPKDLER